jgi:hypothetical protein
VFKLSSTYYEKHKEDYKQRAKKWQKDNPEKAKEINKRYRDNHPEQVREIHKKWWKNNPDKIKNFPSHSSDRQKEWCENNPEKIKAKNKKYRRKLRNSIFELLGNKCANPYNIDHSAFEQNINYIRVLQIDHVNGGGTKHRRKYKGSLIYPIILEELKAGSKDYQCLCPTCNWIKRIVNKK